MSWWGKIVVLKGNLFIAPIAYAGARGQRQTIIEAEKSATAAGQVLATLNTRHSTLEALHNRALLVSMNPSPVQA